MSNSSLVNYTKISPHRRTRTGKISKITIHHMAGNLSVETCANVFQGSRVASSNYGIGSDGRVGLYVSESQRSIASCSTANDNVAVTIEVANSKAANPWPVSDKAYNKLIELCADICKRNGIEGLVYTGDSSGNLTKHNMFYATACPGPYLEARLPAIAAAVNKILGYTKIRYGCEGELVKEAQELLIKAGYSVGSAGVDGDFGSATLAATKAFQEDKGLDVDGVIGDDTWAALRGNEQKPEEPEEPEATEPEVKPEVVEPEEEDYMIRIKGDTPVYKDRPVVVQTLEKGAFTIVEEVEGYGRLKSGAGWIPLAKVEKV